MPAPQRLPAGEEAPACRVPDSRATAVHRNTLVTENQQAESVAAPMPDTIKPCRKQQKRVVRGDCSGAGTAPAGEMSQPGGKRSGFSGAPRWTLPAVISRNVKVEQRFKVP